MVFRNNWVVTELPITEIHFCECMVMCMSVGHGLQAQMYKHYILILLLRKSSKSNNFILHQIDIMAIT